MTDRPTEIERAFQLARSGGPASVEDIKTQLKREGYRTSQIDGPALLKQLRNLIQAAHATGPPAEKG